MHVNGVDIVTRTKDRPLLISRSLESILNQNHRNWTHIIVNDGGDKDVLQSVIARYSDRYAGRLKIVHNSTSIGTGAALNLGMKACESTYVVTHDDDDSWRPDFLEKLIGALIMEKTLNENTRGIIAHSMTVEEYIENGRVIEKCRYSFNGWVNSISLTRLAVGNFIPPISFLFERDVFSKIGFFNESLNYAEDWEFYLRFVSKFEIAVLKEHLANYHIRPTSRDVYGNTVCAGINAHKLAAVALRNDLIRRDIASGKFGVGFLLALAGNATLTEKLRYKLWNMRQRAVAKLKAKVRLR